jgi:hypothetical protein
MLQGGREYDPIGWHYYASAGAMAFLAIGMRLDCGESDWSSRIGRVTSLPDLDLNSLLDGIVADKPLKTLTFLSGYRRSGIVK